MVDITDELATTLGIALDSSVVINTGYSVPYKISGVTIHDMLGYIASAHASCVRITKDEKITFVMLAPGATTTAITASDYFKSDVTNPTKTYTKVALKSNTNGPALTSGSGDDDHTLSIYNPLMDQTMLDDVLAIVNGFSYTPFTMDWKSRPDLEIGDAVLVTLRDSTTFTSTILTNKMSFKGGLKATMTAPSFSPQRSANDFGGDVAKQISKDVLQVGSYGGAINTAIDVTPTVPDRAAIRLVPGSLQGNPTPGYIEVLEDGEIDFYKDDGTGIPFGWIRPDGTTSFGSGSGGGDSYTQPADWIDISTCAAGNINLLVNDETLATYAFICTTSSGQYHVDWGDGTSDNVNSGVKAQRTYTVGAGQACSRGYTTFKIVISPVSGNLTSFKVNPHSLAGSQQEHHILACVCGATNITSLANAFYYSSTPKVICRSLEWFKTSGTLSACTNTSGMCNNCLVLQSIDVSGFTSVTNASSMFSSCYSLRHADVSAMSSVVSAGSMFYYCIALQSVDISNMASITATNGMFSFCYLLQSVDMSDSVLIQDTTNMFYNCNALQTVNIGIVSPLYTAISMFESCSSLRSVTIGGMPNLEYADRMFYGCVSLISVDIDSMVWVYYATSMFGSCFALQHVTSHNFSSSAPTLTAATMFYGCEQLTDIDLSGAKVLTLSASGQGASILNKLATLVVHPSSTFGSTINPQLDLRYTTLTGAQLDAIFTALPTVPVGKYIYITGSTGAATCTRSIATAKGWGVTG